MIDTGTTRLAYDEAGSGPAIVFVHAGVADRRMWDHQFTAFARTHRVVRYDWRGHGGSADHEGPVAHHEDLLALMDALGIERAVLVGASFGGAYCADAALAAPERVEALALVCPGMSGHEWPEAFTREARKMVLGAVPHERLEVYRAGRAEADPGDVAAMAEAQARFMVLGPRRLPEDMPTEAWDLTLLMLRELFARQWSARSSPPSGPSGPPRSASARSPCRHWWSRAPPRSRRCGRSRTCTPRACPAHGCWRCPTPATCRPSSAPVS